MNTPSISIIPATLEEKKPHNIVGTFVENLTFDQFLLYHQLWRALRNGQETPSHRAPLPVELIRIISRMAHLVVLDHALTRITTPTKRTLVRCRDGTIATRLWFWTERLSNAQMDRIAGVQLATRSSDQGWVDSDPELGPQVWFDVGAIPSLPTPPKQDTIHLVTVKHTKALATLEGHGERSKEEAEDTIEAVMALDTRWRRSYGCPSEEAKTVQLERPVFTCDDGMWARAESDTSTRDIAVRACTMFRGWTTHARWGKLTVWKHFEPIVRV